MSLDSLSQRMLAGFMLGSLALLATCSSTAAAEPAVRPNIVLIVADDLGWADLGFYGSKFYHTPECDRLASAGMRFTQAYAACPVCSPTRAALMTGKYPARLHLTDYIPGVPDSPERRLLRPQFLQQLPLAEQTVAELLRGAGYATGSIGKWHLGGAGFEPTRQGFSFSTGGGAAGGVNSHFAPFFRDGRSLPGLEDAPKGEYLADRLTSEAERFLDAHAREPFFLYLPHYSVHTPMMGPSDLVTKYRERQPVGLQRNPIYAAMLENLDRNVGRIVRKLDELGLTDNTLVIFTSDNGGLATGEGPNTPPTINAPLREGKGWLYEGGIRVPLLVRWPARVKAGSTSAVPTSSIDLLPTVAAIHALPLPDKVDGVSLLGVFEHNEPLAARPLFWHYPHYSPQGGKPGGAIRDGDFKLIEFYEQGRRELFNLATDPSESTNLTDREPGRTAELAARLAAWRKDVCAEMPRMNPDFRPDTQAADGTITLPAKTAEVHGVMLRYEPLPHKNTLGFWVRAEDWVSWPFEVRAPGEFEIEILQGCGNGSGGSRVEFTIGDQHVTTTVEETGGFQQFVARRIGKVKLDKAGPYTLSVKPLEKPAAAVMDLRQVRLLPSAVSAAGE